MEQINLKVEATNGQLTILTGKTLEPKEPKKINIEGTIDSPGNFIEKRKSTLNLDNCNLIINRNGMKLTLEINETDPFNNGLIIGALELHPDFIRFQINSGKTWTPFDLSDFIKMNRSFFSSKDEAGNLVKQLRDFKAKVDKTIESFKDDKANFNIKRAQAVDTNLPDSFSVNLSIFKGQPRQTIPIEINIHPETLNCSLCSPDANDIVVKYRENTINDQIERIQNLVPELLIIEQ
jgi:hypothetical protein